MSLLHNVLFAHRCTSTHHKIALDALRHLRCENAAKWQKVFLRRGAYFLAGAKAPDDTFRDYRNHVCHVREKCWGGAVESADTWYKNTVESLRAKQWSKAAYAAGVLSHYYSDPLMPLHTACTEEAGIVHRACERSVFCSYDRLISIVERDLGGFPEIKTPSGPRWLAEMVKTAARFSHEHYDVVIDHYNLAKGRWRPANGLDDEIRVSLAQCLAYAVIGFARILDRALEESGAAAPRAGIALAGAAAWLRIPIMAWSRSRAKARDRRAVKAIYKEVRKTGKAIRTLPDDEKTVRRLHAEDVLNASLETLDAIKPRAVGTRHGTGTYLRPVKASAPRADATAQETGQGSAAAAKGGSNRSDSGGKTAAPRLAKPVPRLAKFHLELSSSLAESPSIGNRTAEKLTSAGIKTVAELLARKPDEVVQRLKLGHIKPDIVREWQIQARLACRVPNLRALDVKVLVACGICEPEELAQCEALDLLDRVDLFLSTSEGQRAIRGGGSQPDLDTVSGWIESARHARALKAA